MLRKLVIRGIATWVIEALGLYALVHIVPDVRVADWAVAFIAVLAIGLLNALVRPLVILLAVNLGVFPFAVVALLANAVMVLLASVFVRGFTVDSLWAAFILAFGLAVVNAVVSSLLGINDDDSFYRNVVRWAERRHAPPGELSTPGTVLVQIDGLAEPILQSELEAGHLPTLQRWLSTGSHTLVRWECDVPSMTSSGQAGILYGNNANIPAFRWYEKASHRLLVSNHPRDAHLIDERQATDHGLLREHGSSVGNIFAGGAEHCVITMSRLTTDSGRLATRTQDLYDYFVNPYNLYRALGAMAWEIVVELWEAWRQRLKRVEPRMHRGGTFPVVRALVTVLLRDITTWMLVADMFAGRHLAYADYLGYDEVAHHAGPMTDDARRVLHKIDSQLRQLESAARRAPREYRFVVLSDHGQSSGATFRQRYGLTLDQLVHRYMQSLEQEGQVAGSSGSGEGAGQVNALLNDAARAAGAVGHGARWLATRLPFRRMSSVDPTGDQSGVAAAPPDVVVCASGNLALVYFTCKPGRLSIEAIGELYPGLVEHLVQHPGIGFVLGVSHDEPVVLGPAGRHYLRDSRLDGADPLDGFSPTTGPFLRRLSTFNDVGDLVINSLWDRATGSVAAFEELIGCHGGAGGAQTMPFILYPTEWGQPRVPIVGAEQLHAFLREHVDTAPSVAAQVELGEHRQVV